MSGKSIKQDGEVIDITEKERERGMETKRAEREEKKREKTYFGCRTGRPGA